MSNFFSSFLPIVKRLQKFKIEIVLISLALIIAFTSLFIFLKNNSEDENITIEDNEIIPQKPSKIVIEIAGAVNSPGVYEVTTGARLKDVLSLAKGLTDETDRNYFSRNYNLARYVSDQEKIYIPFSWEINQGIFVENSRTLDYSQPNQLVQSSNTPVSSINEEKININTATLEELDQLPGIGPVTAQKIIQARPYKTIDELSARKIVNKNVWEKIKNLIVN